MFSRKRVVENYDKFSITELVHMASLKCRDQQDNGGCRECAFLNCRDECVLMGMDDSVDPADWKDLEVEQEEDEDYEYLSSYERRRRYPEEV